MGPGGESVAQAQEAACANGGHEKAAPCIPGPQEIWRCGGTGFEDGPGKGASGDLGLWSKRLLHPAMLCNLAFLLYTGASADIAGGQQDGKCVLDISDDTMPKPVERTN